jgi:LacI family transcriptional regulator
MISRRTSEKRSLPTVDDVAKLAGVSPITVSRFVNGTSYVGLEKQKAIRSAIKTLGYRPNQAARVLRGQRARMIGLILPNLSDPFFGTCASSVEQYAFDRGYVTLIVASNRNQKVEQNEIEMMMAQHIAGLVIVPSTPNDLLHQLVARRVPIIAFDQTLPEIASDEVVVENLGGAHEATSHLVGHGHKRIACIGYDKASYSIRHRILGYTEAMRASALKPEIYDDADTLSDIQKLIRSWKKDRKRPTAIFALNNVTTYRILQTLQDVGLSIPQEIALIGFDDFESAPLLSPSITTVRQPTLNLGKQAARLLFKRIEANAPPDSGSKTKLVLPVELIIRSSCGCTPRSQSDGIHAQKQRLENGSTTSQIALRHAALIAKGL